MDLIEEVDVNPNNELTYFNGGLYPWEKEEMSPWDPPDAQFFAPEEKLPGEEELPHAEIEDLELDGGDEPFKMLTGGDSFLAPVKQTGR